MVDTSNIIIGLVVLMVLGVLMVSVVIPTTQDGIAVSQYAGTVSNEVFTGVAATPATLTKYVAEVLSFEKGATALAANTTALATANGSRTVQLSKPYTGANRTLTIVSVGNLTENNVSFTFNGVLVGKLSSATESWTGLGSTLLNGANTFTFTNNGTANSVNITNVSVSYTSFSANTAYTVAKGKITPAANGTYRAGYYYASTGTNAAFVLLDIIPLLLAVMLVLIIIGYWKLAG
jgi:hypothetical protein